MILWIMHLCQELNNYFKDISFITIFHTSFIKFSSKLNAFSLLKLSTGSFWDIVYPYRLVASQYIGHIDSLFLLLPFIYLLLVFVYQLIAWHITPLIPFSTICSVSISANNSNFISVFFRNACRTNPCAEKS